MTGLSFCATGYCVSTVGHDKKDRYYMIDRQRVEALLRRENPDRVPIYPFALGFATVYAKTSVADAFNNPEASLAAQRKTCEDFGWIFLPVIGYASFGGWEFGGEIKWPSAEFDMAPMVTRLAVATEEDAWALKVPDSNNSPCPIPGN